MANHIARQLSKNVANPLADQFGWRLERMPTEIKLLLTHILSGSLYEIEAYPAARHYNFIEFCHDEMPAELMEVVTPLLQRFDSYDVRTVGTILKVLALSM